MCGNATLAMLVSSTSMNAARATTIAISQGLNLGFQVSVGVATVHILDVHIGIHRQAGPQTMIAIFAGIEVDADRYSLDHFHVIAGRIFWRQQAEARSAGAADLLNGALIFLAVGVDG